MRPNNRPQSYTWYLTYSPREALRSTRLPFVRAPLATRCLSGSAIPYTKSASPSAASTGAEPFAALWTELNEPVKDLQETLGHSNNIDQTMNTYVHIMPHIRIDAFRRFFKG